MQQVICDAIQAQKIVEFSYKGHHRIIEPYKLGVSTAGNLLMTGYQIDGGSSSGTVRDYKQFDIEQIWDLNVMDRTFQEPRQGYSKSDKRLDEIICQV